MPVYFGVNLGVIECKKVKIPLMGVTCPALQRYIFALGKVLHGEVEGVTNVSFIIIS